MRNIRLFVADDHAMIRDGVRYLLQEEPDFKLVGEAVDGVEALEKIRKLKPDVAIIDINMPNMNGLELIAKLQKELPMVKCMVFSIHEEEEYMLKSIKFGARGYILKDAERDEFLEGIRTIAKGGSFFGKDTEKLLLKSYISRLEPPQNRQDVKTVLTVREKEILTLVAQGLSSKEIGKKLFISARTVDNHRSNIMQKLGFHSASELVSFAIKEGLI